MPLPLGMLEVKIYDALLVCFSFLTPYFLLWLLMLIPLLCPRGVQTLAEEWCCCLYLVNRVKMKLEGHLVANCTVSSSRWSCRGSRKRCTFVFWNLALLCKATLSFCLGCLPALLGRWMRPQRTLLADSLVLWGGTECEKGLPD